ncbi:imidazole glycerol phosphate synthase subunit HisH [Sphingopyxis macrogoltabida]|uniref:Imidazole glycerol phosphate synthase subunit HisH n=1 Tax=Sphingopyxis macrogoltabida TaxID=33050 RepID=A0A0N9UIX6_SPHMC|nr:imidazole glycerol phosphate synthase subunit HisH [Sphingopyxis macrogoltabida]ALH78910.1 imidazole glycerol phosphate synthase subunit HisH [Sphingopyxis macrogoltabida]
MAETIALIDYGAGNLRSVYNALIAAGADGVDVTFDPDAVLFADRIVLPGVGAFGACAAGLASLDGMIDALTMAVIERATPFLGICVGMQLLADAGEEHGRHKGLGWIGGTVRAFDPAPGLRIPHMGWNDVVPTFGHPVIAAGEAYYLHGYHFADAADVAATSSHGGTFTAAVARDNIVGVQFHPEKSQAYGLATLERFLQWRP